MKKIIGFIIVMMMCVVGTAFANAAEMNYTDGTLTINGLNGSADLLHASYTGGVLDSTEILNVSDGTYNINAKNGDKLFLWDNTNTMKPLSGNIIVGEKNQGENLEEDTQGKILVVYFSAQSHTERVANYIAQETGADIFELVPKNPYTSADLNYSNSSSRVVYEYQHPEERNVELVSAVPPNWDSYDTVFVGYPIWWGVAAWPVNGFVTANDFTDKTVIPFCTSASSGIGQSGTLLRDSAKGGNWLNGMRFSSSASESTVKSWVASLDLN